MRLPIVLISFVFSTAALAQYELKLSEQQLNVVLEALSNASWRVANPVIADIHRQLQEAQKKVIPSPEKKE